MSIVPPDITPVPITVLPPSFRTNPDVTPFTYRSGITYASKLEYMDKWIRTILVPYLDTNFQDVQSSWTSEVDTILAAVNTALAQQADEVQTNLADVLQQIVNGANAELNDAHILQALQLAASTARDYLDLRYRRTVIVPVGTSTTVDSTAAIQSALDSGADVDIVGPFGVSTPGQAVISSTIRTNPNVPYQRLRTVHAQIVPNFRGDAVQMTTAARIDVDVRGTLQPATGDYTAVAAIRIGSIANSYNPQQGSIAYSNVQNWKGDAVVWEAGAMIDFTHFHADTVSGNGVNCLAAGNDNNHGNFANTHIVKAGGKGYALLGDGSNLNSGGSRHHVFTNAKAFQCGQNFYIESRSNGGRVFSELSITPDTFTVTSRGNDFSVHETAAAFEGWVDNGQGNRLSGYSNNNTWETKNNLVRNVVAEQILQFPGGKQIDNVKTAAYTIPSTPSLAAGAFASYTLETGSWAATMPAMGTLYGPDPTKFALAFSVGTSGALMVTVRNIDTQAHDVSGYQLRYLGFHIAN